MTLEDELGDIIRKARLGLGYNRVHVADAAHMSEADLARIEGYELTPGRSEVDGLARMLSLDPEKLVQIADGSWEPAKPSMASETARVEVVPVPFGDYLENCYILACNETLAAAVIDPGGSAPEILKGIDERGLRLDLVLITHTHQDHIGGLCELLAAQPGVRVASHPLDRNLADCGDQDQWLPALEPVKLSVGKLNISVLYTPGHTAGSVCYFTNGFCFVGDTLFAGSIGRPSSSEIYEEMLATMKSKVLSLPEETVILPGHGPVTTVGQERAHNPFF